MDSVVYHDSVTDDFRDAAGAITSFPGAGGGGLPDPSGEPDGQWLRTASGAAVWVATTASDIPFVPAGSIVATDVQAAIIEVEAEIPTSLPPSGSAGGALDGTYPNPGLNASVAGAGLAESSDVLAVNVDGTTVEINADALRVKPGVFDAAGAAASAQAASQPLDSDLTALAGLDSSTSGAISSDGAGWIKKTYSQFKTALSLVKGDVGLGNVDNTSDADKPVSTAQQTALDLKVDENAGITGATKTKITYDSKGLVTAGADATTADIADSSNKRYVTDAQQTVIGNTSGTNTGDQDLSVLVPKSLYDANTVLAADTDNTPAALTMGASTILARLASGNIKAATPAELRTLLALVIGTNVEAWDADLDAIAALTPTNDDVVQRKAGAWTNRSIAQLLVDLAAAGTTFQPLDSDLTSIAALTTTSFGRGLLTEATAASARTTLGIAGAVGGVEWTSIIKSGDQDVSSNTTPAADSELKFTAASGGVYEFMIVPVYLSAAGAGTPDFKAGFGEDATARGAMSSISVNTSDSIQFNSIICNTSNSFSFGTAATARAVLMLGVYWGGGGTAALNWSQVTSGLNATTVKAGSILRYRRLF